MITQRPPIKIDHNITVDRLVEISRECDHAWILPRYTPLKGRNIQSFVSMSKPEVITFDIAEKINV